MAATEEELERFIQQQESQQQQQQQQQQQLVNNKGGRQSRRNFDADMDNSIPFHHHAHTMMSHPDPVDLEIDDDDDDDIDDDDGDNHRFGGGGGGVGHYPSDPMMDGSIMDASVENDGAGTLTSGAGSSGTSGSVPDVMLLNIYCARAKAPKETEQSVHEAEQSWQPVREWLSSHSADQVRAAAEQRGESGLTALHFACRHVPPLAIIDVFLSIAVDTVQWPDTFGWLPIHYACASGSDTEVIRALAEAYPESKTVVDRRGRTPLHFALGDKPASPDVIFLLSSSGAASYPDEIGMLPLHYACAFGASEEVLYVLTDAYPEAIKTKDKRDRTPLHFALSNAGRKTVPSAVRLLLSLNREIVNSMDGGPLPLRVLAEYANTIKTEDEKREEKRESVHRCLEHLLHARPDPTADFLTALQSLPDWLSERAVVMPVVQILLNEKIAQRFPTAVLILDFYVLAMIIVAYSLNVEESIQLRFSHEPGDDHSPSEDAIATIKLVPLYAGAGYFIFREVVQIISLISLKSFDIWLYDPSNHLNVAFVFLITYWTVRMDTGTGDRDGFRVGATLSVTILWVKLLAYLRNMMIDFAVFVGGVFYVVRRLVAFLTSLCVILIAFSQMFYTIFQQTPQCTQDPNYGVSHDVVLEEQRCNALNFFPYCDFWQSFVTLYSMLLGEVDETNFVSSGVATVLYIMFVFLVVILLANVLIAIVTDSYKVIQDQRAAIVFWTNRLDYVAEMDAIANGPWRRRLRLFLGYDSDRSKHDDNTNHSSTGGGRLSDDVFGKDLWKQIMDLFEDEVEEGILSFDFVVYTCLRLIAAVVVIPAWLALGVFTFGWFWPPQVREAVFTSTVFKHSSDSELEDELRKTQVKKLQEEVKDLKYELLQELAMDRTQVVQMKSLIGERRADIVNEMKDIKRIVAVLFERQAGLQS